MKQRIFAALLAVILAVSPSTVSLAQSSAEQVDETEGIDAAETEREKVGEEAEARPVELQDFEVVIDAPAAEAEWNLVDEETEETEEEETVSRTTSRAAGTAKTAETGSYGENITYAFDASTGVLNLSGSGDMMDTTGTSTDWPFYSFKDQITAVVVGDGITSIGNYAFYRCGSLQSISLPAGVTSIGRRAFFDCTALSQIEIPAGVTAIGEAAFFECTSLTEIQLPVGITVLEEAVFENCSKLQQITVPENVTEIKERAFHNCYALEQVSLPVGLQKIGTSAFFDCWALSEIVLPGSVTEMGNYVFNQCYAMKKAVFSAGLSVVPAYTFANCKTLAEVELPKGIQEIGENAFCGCSLTEIVLPEGVISVGKTAFANCENLEKVTLPSSISVIGENAFQNTAYAESLSNTEFVIAGSLLYQYNGNGTVVTIPEGVTAIGDSVFKGHKEIVEVQMPDSLQSVGASAFEDCEALEKVTVPESVTTIGADAFSGTAFLEGQEEGLLVLGKVVYKYTGADTSVRIPDGMVSISPYAFLFCYSLERVMIPESMTSIGDYAFVGCHALTYLKIPAGVTEIGHYAIGYYCANGGSGTYLPMTMTLAGYTGTAAQTYAEDTSNSVRFLSIDQLTGTCGDGLSWELREETGELFIRGSGSMTDYTSYGEGVSPFASYRNMITSVTLEEGVTSVGSYAFYNLDHLETVSLPESLTSVGNYAFCDCGELETVTLPGAVLSIGTGAWSGCENLQAVEIAPENESYCSENGLVYDKAKTELLVIPSRTSTETLFIPDTVKKIGDYAAQNNKSLKNVYFPESVTSIGMAAFSGCSSLKNLVFQGTAPRFTSYSSVNTEGITIYCSFSDEQWSSKMETLTYPSEKVWMDLDVLGSRKSLTLTAGADTLAVGETLPLTAELDPALALDFVWTSSNPETAGIASDGRISAYRPGEVTITVRSADGVYEAERNFTVTGEAYQLPVQEVTELAADVLSYTSISVETMQIPCEQQNGFYLLSGNKLTFYSVSSKQSIPVYTFTGCTRAYSTGEKLYVVYQEQCTVYDLQKRCVERTLWIPGYTATAVGADASGRIYVAADDKNNSYDHRIFLYSSDGVFLSQTPSGTQVYRFDGFDSTNGNFYIEVYYDYYSWGYSHPGLALRMGNVTENVIRQVTVYSSVLESGLISRGMDNILYLCQNVHKKHQSNAVLLGGRYLTAVSVLTGQVQVMDSWTESLNICQSYIREPVESEAESSYYDTSSIGVRTVYHEGHDSLILYENGCLLTEYDIQTGSRVAEYQTAHNVFNMFWMGETLVLIEKENNIYYVEMVEWSDPEGIEIIGNENMQMGETQHLEIQNGKPYTSYYVWNSSDQRIASVSENGDLTAWKAGTTVITVSNRSGTLTSSYTVTVQERQGEIQKGGAVSVTGMVSDNVSDNNYTVWSNTAKSYLAERSDQTLERIEYIAGKGVVVENWTKDGQLLGSRILEAPLSLFGGFYGGETYNFLVFGQTNEQEDNGCEVLRVVKYSKDWAYLGAYSAFGANTYIPFDAGALRMAETNGKLYIHTCHEMYMSGDGLHHQANMTFVVDEASMTELQSYYNVMNIAQAGYVSHSFNQFVQTDGTYVYRVDHGDANPRAIALTRTDVDGEITDVRYTLPLSIQSGFGANATGVSAGGFELSADNCLIVGNSVDQSDAETYSEAGQRNIFLTVTSKSLTENKIVWLTDYAEADGITPRTPQIVKLNDWQFLILWEEYNRNTQATCTKMVTIDGDGKQISDIVGTDMRLSDCQPIGSEDGMVRWYVTDGVSVQLYTVNPYQLESIGTGTGSTGTGSTGTGGTGTGTTGTGSNGNQESSGASEGGSGVSEPVGTELPKVGKKLTASNGSIYTVTAAGSFVAFAGTGNKKSTSVVIPSSVTIGEVTYRVTSIADNAFKGNKTLKKITIPATVTKIGKKAFYNCKKLQKITIKTTKLTAKRVGAQAFTKAGSRNYKKLKVKVPAKKLTVYKKILRKRGLSKKAKITK